MDRHPKRKRINTTPIVYMKKVDGIILRLGTDKVFN